MIDDDAAAGRPAAAGSPRRLSARARLRNYFLTGLIVAGPLAITIYITWWFTTSVDAWVKPLVPARYLPESYLPFTIPGFGLVLAFLVVPALVYTISYAGWFAHFGWDLGEWARMQGAIADYHEGLRTPDPTSGEPVHAYLSEAWQWLLMWRPTFYYGTYVEDTRRVIYAQGNAAIFWGSLLAIPYVTYLWWRRRDWRAGFLIVAIAAQYLPWLLIPRPQFFFYATPIAPFLVLVDVYAIRRLWEIRLTSLSAAGGGSKVVRPYTPVVVGFVVIAVALFVWFWPVHTGATVTTAEFLRRAWFPTWS